MSQPLNLGSFSVSTAVLSQVVREAAEQVEGVVRVGGNDIASSLVNVFTTKSVLPDEAVVAELVDGKLKLTVHVAVFYGYVFTQLADDLRAAVAKAVLEQVGVEAAIVDICIDSLVFLKE